MDNQQSIGEKQNNQKKEWYNSGIGIVIAILFLPYFLIWYMWAKINWSNKTKLIITVVFIAINIAVFTSDESESEKITTVPKEQKAETTNKVEETASNQENTEEDKQAELTDEEKGKLESFYDDILAKSKIADDAYANWANELESNTPTQAYMDAEELKKVIKSQKQQIVDLEIPDVNISEDDKKELVGAISDISTMYFTKLEGIELMQDYLNTGDMKKLTKAKEEFELSNSFLITGLGKIMKVFIKYDVELPSS